MRNKHQSSGSPFPMPSEPPDIPWPIPDDEEDNNEDERD